MSQKAIGGALVHTSLLGNFAELQARRRCVEHFENLQDLRDDADGSGLGLSGANHDQFSLFLQVNRHFTSRDADATRERALGRDRKSTRLNSSHPSISYAVFCLKKKRT